jgi:hypothetical protein
MPFLNYGNVKISYFAKNAVEILVLFIPAPPHLISASLPCQDDDVRMATATILLGPARGSRRGVAPARNQGNPGYLDISQGQPLPEKAQ